jgi:hypothetical protein
VLQLFFGTPHFGASTRQVQTIAERFAPLERMGEKGNWAGLTNAIVANSNDLMEISEDFCQLAERYPITSWYEMRNWPGTKQPIVDAASSRLEIETEHQLGVDADHLAMCRFENAEDGTFQEVCDRIHDAIETGCKSSTSTEVRTSHRPTPILDSEPTADFTSSHDLDVQQTAIFAAHRQDHRATHRIQGAGTQPNVVVRAAIEVRYPASASRDDPVGVIEQARRDTMDALRDRLAIEESRNTKDSILWGEEAVVATVETVTPGTNGAAENTNSTSWWFRQLTGFPCVGHLPVRS